MNVFRNGHLNKRARRLSRRLAPERLEMRRLLAAFAVVNLNDGPVSAAGNQPGTLRQAIFDANANPGPDTIGILTSGMLTMTNGTFDITDSVTIDGPDDQSMAINGNGQSRIFDTASGTDVEIRDLVLSGGSSTVSGGAIINRGGLTIRSSLLSGNSAFSNGGAIRSLGSGLTVVDCSITGNNSGSYGGAIDHTNGPLSILDSTISGNVLSGGLGGGGIYADSDSESNLITISGSTISGNSSAFAGGGIYISLLSGGQATITDTVIEGNIAGTNAGGLFVNNQGGTLTISDSMISGNQSQGGGSYAGGLFVRNNGGTFTISDSLVSGNQSEGVGGGVTLRTFTGGDTRFINTAVFSNSAGGKGGGLNIESGGGTTLVDQSIITANRTTGTFGYGGGIYAGYRSTGDGTITISNSVVSGNSTHVGSGGGGIAAIAQDTLTIRIENSEISGNHARLSGGGINAREVDGASNVVIQNSTISANSADLSGGGVATWEDSFPVSILHSTITGNLADADDNATGGGGGLVDGSTGVFNSIIAGNDANSGTGPDVLSAGLLAFYSLIGDNSDANIAEAQPPVPDTFGNFVGDPGGFGVIIADLGPLSDNGGPTRTHALLDGSPAIDVGDPSFTGPPDFDQRGSGFDRVKGGRIDMGAFESSPALAVDRVGTRSVIADLSTFFLDASGDGIEGPGDIQHSFGLGSDVPIIGDWDGDGADNIGVRRGDDFLLDQNGDGLWDSGVDRVINNFGFASDTPLVGDWNGDGTDEIGVRRGDDVFLDVDNSGTWNPAVDRIILNFGFASDTPLVGDWDGDKTDEIGVRRSDDFFLDFDNSGTWNPAVDQIILNFGFATDTPLIGDWDGDGSDDIGTHRGHMFFLDSNGNDVWNSGVDRSIPFGLDTDTPLVGKWTAPPPPPSPPAKPARVIAPVEGDHDQRSSELDVDLLYATPELLSEVTAPSGSFATWDVVEAPVADLWADLWADDDDDDSSAGDPLNDLRLTLINSSRSGVSVASSVP